MLMLSLVALLLIMIFFWRSFSPKVAEEFNLDGSVNQVFDDAIEEDSLIYESRESKKDNIKKNINKQNSVENLNDPDEDHHENHNGYKKSDRDYLNKIIKKVN